MLARPDGPAMLQVTRRANGTLEFRSMGKRFWPELGAQWGEDQASGFWHWVGASILEHAMEAAGPEALAAELALARTQVAPGPEPELRREWYMQDLTETALEQVLVTDPGWKEEQPQACGAQMGKKNMALLKLPGRVRDLVEEQMADGRTRKMAAELFDPQGEGLRKSAVPLHRRKTVPLRHYNMAALNLETFRQLEQTAPNVLSYYCRHICPDREPEKIPHPGEIVQAVREHTRLTPRLWREFHRHWTPGAEQVYGGLTGDALRALEALAAIRRPGVPAELMDAVLRMSNEHRWFAEAQWEAGDPWEAWTRLLGRWVDHMAAAGSGQQNGGAQRGKLQRVVDPLQGHITAGLPWGKGSWPVLEERSERWHRLLRAGGGRDDPRAAAARWNTLVEELEAPGGFDLRARTTGKELQSLGRRMGNCLGTFWQRCLRGETRIFSIHQDGQLVGAVELKHYRDQWKIGQMEAPGRGTLPDGMREAAEALLDAYQQAQGSTRGEHPPGVRG